MRVHYLQHVPFEGLGSMEPWFMEAGFEITSTPFFKSSALPDLDDVDMVVAMGGPMSVNDEKEFPWLVREKQFIGAAIEAGKAVLGVCLGAQLIACSMGARVFGNRFKEIGWFPIQGAGSGAGAGFRFPSSVEVFHWHGETFDLPPGAVRLARSAGCDNQAFQLGRSVIGLQFHLETTPESARALVSNCRDELSPSKYVQSETTILGAGQGRYREINGLMADVLTYLLEGSD